MADPTTFYFTQGVLGVTVVVLGLVVYKLYNDGKGLYKRIEELQDLRLQDSIQVTKDVTAVLSGNAEAIRILTEKIGQAKGRDNL